MRFNQIFSNIHIRFFRNEIRSIKDENEKNNTLVEGHSKNVLAHLLGDYIFAFSIRRSLKQRLLRFFSGESKRRERVHNQVDPKELNGLQWRFPHDN